MKFNWNPDLYDDKHDFAFKFSEEIVKHTTIPILHSRAGGFVTQPP